jgi:hypothetical protein
VKEGIAEILQKVSKQKTKKDKMSMLLKLKDSTPHIFTILKYIFKQSILWDLPEGNPPYKPQPKEADLQNVLYSDFRRVKIFMKGEYPQMKPMKREILFIEFLESLDPDDAKLIISMKDKKSPYKGLTKKLICDTYPKDTVDW